MLTNSQYQLNPQTKSHIINYTSLQGKTRMDSLIERIHSANKEIDNILESSTKPKKAVKIEKEKKANNNNNNNNTEAKPPQILNEIITQDNNDNNKSVQVGLDENLNNENKENKDNNENQETEGNNNENKENNENNENKENQETEENNNDNKENIENNENKENQEQFQEKKEDKNEEIYDIDIPFIKKTKSILKQLKIMKEKAGIKEDDINNEITELPKRAMIEMSLSDFKIKKKYESVKKELDEKNKYIKKLENEIVNQRILTNNLKKSESEYLLKISALEDELRVMKSKLIGQNASEQHNRHNHQQYNTDMNNCGHVYGEKLVQSMWIRDNISNSNLNNFEMDNSRPILNKGERWRAPWISQSQGNMNRLMMRNINRNLLNNNNNGNVHTKTENRYSYELGEKNYFDNNDRYESYKYNNNFNGGNSNFQRVSGMILETPNRIKLTKNFSNDFNRFRIGNNNNNFNSNY